MALARSSRKFSRASEIERPARRMRVVARLRSDARGRAPARTRHRSSASEARPGQIGDDLAADRDLAGLDAAVALLPPSRPGRHRRRLLTGGSVAEGDGDVAMQLRLVRLHDEQVVALSVTHMAADLALGEDRIAGDDRTLQGQSLEQRQRRRNLVRLGRHDEVGPPDLVAAPERRRAGGCRAGLAVKRDVPARRLAARVASELAAKASASRAWKK